MGPKRISIAVFCIGAAGCVSALPPIDRLAASEACIRDANAAGAARMTPASLYLALADQEVAKARALMAAGEHELADLQLLRAQADAELALDIARDNLAHGNATHVNGAREAAAHPEPTDHTGVTGHTGHTESNVDALPDTGKP